jgi:uncharacterized membrane protein YgcG
MRARQIALAVALALLAAAPAAAQRTLVIERFDVAIQVNVDGTIEVDETIRPRFTGSWNGIYRTIPIEYRTPQGLNYTLRLIIESVTDGAGAKLRYETSRERHYRKVKVWVPGAVDATRTVHLRYRVPDALRFFDEHDELYWNVTGDEWDVPIESAAAVIHLPAGVSGVRATAFRGTFGSTDRAPVSIDGNVVTVEAAGGLGFHEGLTAVVGWNPGVVHRPTAVEKTARVVSSNLPLAIPPLVFAGMWSLWRRRGRDPKLGPVTTRYEPPDAMTPAEVGTLIDGKPDMRDITATIVDLAVRGYLHITESESGGVFGFFSSKDYTFALKKPREGWSGLKTHERDLLDAMFGTGDEVRLADLKNKFYKHLPGLRDGLYSGLVSGGFYKARPDRVRLAYIAGGIAAGVAIGVVSASIMGALGMQPGAGIIAGVLSAAAIIGFGIFMPARTIHGTRGLESILGFQEFLSRVEADRLQRMVKTPELFEKFLPFAMALGVEDNWARAFEGIYREPPQWYTGPPGGPMFQPRAFTGNLSRMSTQAAAVMASSPRSSSGSGFSGGSSGGGFGGGGGGGF